MILGGKELIRLSSLNTVSCQNITIILKESNKLTL